MYKVIALSFLFCFSAFSGQRYFIMKKKDLYIVDGKQRLLITKNVTSICFPYLLKGKDLYFMIKDDLTRVLLVTKNIDKLYAGSFIRDGKLYQLTENRFEFITSGVSKVYNDCLPQNYPEIYLPKS